MLTVRYVTRAFAYAFVSTAVAWAFYALGSNPAVHAKLNVEVRAFYTDTPSMDELNGMTYLDYITREVLRLHAPVSQTERIAKEDTVVPLSEPFIDRHGVQRHGFRQVISLVRLALVLLNST